MDIEKVEEAIWREQSFGYAHPGPPHRRMAQAAVAALKLMEETGVRFKYASHVTTLKGAQRISDYGPNWIPHRRWVSMWEAL